MVCNYICRFSCSNKKIIEGLETGTHDIHDVLTQCNFNYCVSDEQFGIIINHMEGLALNEITRYDIQEFSYTVSVKSSQRMWNILLLCIYNNSDGFTDVQFLLNQSFWSCSKLGLLRYKWLKIAAGFQQTTVNLNEAFSAVVSTTNWTDFTSDSLNDFIELPFERSRSFGDMTPIFVGKISVTEKHFINLMDIIQIDSSFEAWSCLYHLVQLYNNHLSCLIISAAKKENIMQKMVKMCNSFAINGVASYNDSIKFECVITSLFVLYGDVDIPIAVNSATAIFVTNYVSPTNSREYWMIYYGSFLHFHRNNLSR